MNRTRTLTTVLAAALLAFALPAFAQELGLTDAQRTKLRDIGEAQMRRGIQERADIRIAELDLRKLLRADKPDQGAINRQVDKIADMRAKLAKERIAARLQMREVLTPEQRAKARGMLEMDGMPGMRGMRGMRRGHAEMPDGGGPEVGGREL